MTKIQQRLVNAYTTLLLAERLTEEDVPNTQWELKDGTITTLREEVIVAKAIKEIEHLG